MEYEILFASEKGKLKDRSIKDNQDSIVVDKDKNIYIVADGMGGKNEPVLSSLLSTNIVYMKFREIYGNLTEGKMDRIDIEWAISESLHKANKMISGAASGIKSKGMGSTIDACLIYDDILYYGHVGNGRIYIIEPRIQGYDSTKLTEEHVLYPFEKKEFTSDQLTAIEIDLGLTSFIGISQKDEDGNIKELKADIGKYQLKKNEIFLIATDGLTHVVSEREIFDIVSSYDDVNRRLLERVNEPIDMALAISGYKKISTIEAKEKLGGMDNISYIIGRCK